MDTEASLHSSTDCSYCSFASNIEFSCLDKKLAKTWSMSADSVGILLVGTTWSTLRGGAGALTEGGARTQHQFSQAPRVP